MTDPVFTPLESAEWKQISPGFYMLLPAQLTQPDMPHPGWSVTLDLDFDGQTIGPNGVRVASNGAGAVSGTDLRSIPVASLLGDNMLGPWMTEHVRSEASWQKPPEEIARIAASGPTNEAVRDLADMYLFARAIRIPAKDFVAQFFSLPKPTLARWLRKARELGYIDGDD